MTNNSKDLRAVLNLISGCTERSPLFWWMVENHEPLKLASEGKRLQWEPLSELFHQLGLTDINGNPVKPVTARQTWLRARRFIADKNKQSGRGKRASSANSKQPNEGRTQSVKSKKHPQKKVR